MTQFGHPFGDDSPISAIIPVTSTSGLEHPSHSKVMSLTARRNKVPTVTYSMEPCQVDHLFAIPIEYCKWSTANMGMFGWGLVLLESKLSWWEWGFCWRFTSKTWDMGSDIAMDENEDRACGDLWSKISFYRDSNHPQWMIYSTMNDLLGEEVINAMCVW